MTTPSPDAAQDIASQHEALRAQLLHRDGMVLVINKPAGLPVHRGPQAQGKRIPVLTDYLDELRFGLPRKPEAAHRLDKDTSGCLVLGRHPRALALLNALFSQGRVGKTYWAIVEGSPAEDAGIINLAIAKRDETRGWWMKVSEDGLPSRTLWRVLGRGLHEGKPIALMELKPETGRTHQLRVHCQAMGWPILGDPIYGTGDRFALPSLCLHAREISLPIFPKKPPLVVTAPPPGHMQSAMQTCGYIPQAKTPPIGAL
ncbi:MAG: RluA family pseudouridine synthase [Bosea sp. (in: a-proteobacteria)]